MTKPLCVVLTFILLSFASAAPPTVVSFPVGVIPNSGIQKAEVDTLIAVITELYFTDVEKKGHHLAWDFNWEQPYIGAGSYPPNEFFRIMLWGGFVRAPQVSIESLALILCHELGHLLGGPPYLTLDASEGNLISAEGQADFFAAQSCLPRLIKDQRVHFRPTSHAFALQFCSADETCEKILETAQDFAVILHSYFDRFNTQANIEQSSAEIASTTLIMSYPSDQCRIDTYKAAALCQIRQAQCVRPRCWFKE